ncbi:cytochrome P450 [Virgisporangium aliadipatigenens]|uniref:Cytochrome P450 n=1 Tax=Virgisporangium aliadipatigenens TaxID=741659 RepID=A0A8J4DUV2_9ACTN|nr:cytochrome P450 [Virgisporangium aliadipatigenens]GIJ51189.1 cytochrome P450 [Virgisporangium aliadipatigenens]
MTDVQVASTPKHASIADTARVAATVLAPVIARGVIVRRPRLTGLLARTGADRRAMRTLRRIRERYGPGPVRLRIPARPLTLVLDADEARRVLEQAPAPFSPANREKIGALAHFQPEGVLISRGRARDARRAFNERALDTSAPVHHLAGPILASVSELGGALRERDPLVWRGFAREWWRAVRTITLGPAARDDTWVTDSLRTLRRAGNWSYFHPTRRDLRERFLQRVRDYITLGHPDSLAGTAARADVATAPEHQIAHWLFAWDAAGMAVFRTLALLATHPAALARARADQRPLLPYLRACVLESLRLWPTTPLILRDTTADLWWGDEIVPEHTPVLIHAAFLHRDPTALDYADTFAPDVWLDGRAERHGGIVPFSGGPARCPAENLVLLTTSHLLAELITGDPRLTGGRLDPERPMPALLSPFGLRFSR